MITIIFLGLFFLLIAYGFFESYKNVINNPALGGIREKYQIDNAINIKMKPRIFYYWNENGKKEYINGAMFSCDKDGVYLKGNLLDSWWFKPTFIPWDDLVHSGTMRWMLYLKLDIYHIESLDCFIAFPKK